MTSDIAAPKSAPQASDPSARRREWFAQFAADRVMPLLNQVSQALSRRGFPANARLHDSSGRLVAEMEVLPPGLPATARPPLLTITATRPPRLPNAPATPQRQLLVEFTGTFPGVGAGGGFGAEVDYNTVSPAQLEQQVDAFVRLATGR